MNRSGTSQFGTALDTIGRAIVTGQFPPDHADTIEGLVDFTGTSRSVVRETTRILGSLGMLTAARRVGLKVLSSDHWDTMDPLVIRWRLQSGNRNAQMQELRELRMAIEPEAARLAATRVQQGSATSVELGELTDSWQGMQRIASQSESSTSESPDTDYLWADNRLHCSVLSLASNMMFSRLQSVIEESLRERALRERQGLPPRPHDVNLHRKVAFAILDGSPNIAADAMREIVVRTAHGEGSNPAQNV